MTGTDETPTPTSAMLCAAWADAADVPEADRSLVDTATWDVQLLRASEILYSLAGERWLGGGCTDTVTLRSHAPAPGTGTWPYHPSWGSCSGCWMWAYAAWMWAPQYVGSHPEPVSIKLPHAEVTGVTSFTVDGEPFTGYSLSAEGWLTRTDGGTWDLCHQVSEVIYTYGQAPPIGGKQSAVALAIEFAKSIAGDTSCRLPRRITSITRQGVSLALVDPMRMFADRRTGIYEVDLWLTAVNPSSRARRARVWSPDIPITQR